MTPALFLWVTLAGGLGAAFRYLTDFALPAPVRSKFPWATLIVNALGSFLIGIVAGAMPTLLPESTSTVLGTGLLGGYTTFSAASLQTVQLVRKRKSFQAAIYALGSFVLCLALGIVGLTAVT